VFYAIFELDGALYRGFERGHYLDVPLS
jgi:hypothetical protein